MAAPGGSDTLPEDCSYGVCQDGRVFFIDDRNRSTSWLHPRSQDPINTGHMIRSDLPPGWEEGFTEEGASFFIDHNQRRTTFCHPVTGEISPENHEFDLREEEILLAPQQPMSQRPCSMVSETSTAVSGSTAEPGPAAKAPKPAGKVYSFGKRAQSIKRNQSAPVVARGWLHKQDGSGMHLWKRRWFLLADFCLFYYKDSREEDVLGSIPLPGYRISPTDPEDRVNRKHSFKAVHTGMRAYIQQQEHSGMRTYYFSADTQEDLNGWMKAMNQAAQMESAPTAKRSSEETDWQLAPDHMDPTNEYSKLETLQTNNNHQTPDDLYFVRKHEDQRTELVEDRYTSVMVNAEGGTSKHLVANDHYESKAPYLPSKHEDLKPELFEDRYASITANSNGGTSKQFFSNDQHKPKALYLPSRPEDLKTETLEQDHYTSLTVNTKSRTSKHFASDDHQKPKEPSFSTRQDNLRSEPVEGDRYASLTVNTKSGPSKHFVSSDRQKPKEAYFSRKHEDPRLQLVEDDCYAFQKLNSKVLTSKQFSSSDAESAFTEFSKAYRSQSAQPQPSERNGTLPSSFSMSASPGKQNGMDKQGFVQRAVPEKQVQRRSNMAQVEQWVKIQKGDTKSAVSDHTLPRQYNHPPHYTERYQTLPKTRQPSASSPPPSRNLPSDYKYAHDRVNHFKMSNQERKATKDGMVWQLYEWQQRQQFKHGSPTGPINMNTLGYTDRNRSKSFLDVPRCISVPPSPSDIPPAAAAPKACTLRRPHTPAERVTVRPEDLHGGSPPPKLHFDVVKSAAHLDRRSLPMLGYMTHTVSAPSLHGKSADDTYLQMKKDLEYLDLKVTGRGTLKERSWKPVRIAESDIDVKLSILCEQDRILQDLEDKIRALKDNKDKLETVLEVLHRQMDQYKDQPQHTEKISYQQRLLQEDLVQIRAEMSKVSSDMENSWNEYLRLEGDVSQLRQSLQKQMQRSPSSQEKTRMQKDLWRIEDVTAGLSANKLNYSALVESFKNPERKTVPLNPSQLVPSGNTAFTSIRSKSLSPLTQPLTAKPTSDMKLFSQSYPQTRSPSQPQLLQKSDPLPHSTIWNEDAPPRPPLPDIYSPNDPGPPPNIPPPPALPPPPRESSIIRHTSVRGLKRQSDERKRDRELGQWLNGDHKADLRIYVSDPELADTGLDNQQMPGLLSSDSGYQTLPGRGLSGSTSRLPQSSSVTSYVTLRRGASTENSKERPISAFERLYSGDDQRGKMSAEEQLQRMKRHQKALVRERKRTLSQGDKQSTMSQSTSRPVSADISSWKREQDFDLQLLERAARDVDDRDEDKWMKVKAVQIMELNLDPEEYEFDISKELSMPDKVAIPERYVELEPEEPLSTDEVEARQRKVQKIKNILARSSVHNLQPAEYPVEADLDSQWEEQERMITISHALASEASRRSKQVAAHAVTEY